jgi:hypothetical protein
LSLHLGSKALLADTDFGVFVTMDVFLVWGALLTNEGSAHAAMMFAPEDPKELGADYAGVKALVRDPLHRLVGR